jgi:hypothetical protein
MEHSKSLSLELRAGEIQISGPQSVLQECVIFFAFPKSRSANLPIALGLAKSATAYGEQLIEGKILYWAGFTKSPKDLKVAAELIRLAGNWAGAITRIYGRNIKRPFNAYLTLTCYEEALQCTSQAAHCHRIIDDPFHPKYDAYSQKVNLYNSPILGDENSLEREEEIKEFVFPCKKMLDSSMFHPLFKFIKSYGVSSYEQIQAAAVEYGISFCPFFDAQSFKEIGARKQKVRIPLTKEIDHDHNSD